MQGLGGFISFGIIGVLYAVNRRAGSIGPDSAGDGGEPFRAIIPVIDDSASWKLNIIKVAVCLIKIIGYQVFSGWPGGYESNRSYPAFKIISILGNKAVGVSDRADPAVSVIISVGGGLACRGGDLIKPGPVVSLAGIIRIISVGGYIRNIGPGAVNTRYLRRCCYRCRR